MKERKRQKPPNRVEPADLDLEAKPKTSAKRCPLCHADVPPEHGYRCTKCRARHHLGCLGESKSRRCAACGGPAVAERRLRDGRLGAEQTERSIHQRAFVLALLLGLLSSCGFCWFFGSLYRLVLDREGNMSLWEFLPVIVLTLAASGALGWAVLNLGTRFARRGLDE